MRKQLKIPSDVHFAEKIVQTLETLNIDDRFSPLRNPEQVFLLALGISAMEHTDGKEFLARVIPSQTKGSPARQILYAAAMEELGVPSRLAQIEPKDIADIIALLWWKERYEPNSDKSAVWVQFENSKDAILLYKVEDFDTRRVLSPWELALLYEAAMRQTTNPEPNMLFDSYPLHPRIREIAETDFKQGNYFGAVFEACKALEDFLRTIASSADEAVPLVKKVLGDPNQDTTKKPLSPLVKLNPLDSNSTDYKSQLNEQKGFAAIGIGIFQAFRNPKGHEPKDKHWVEIDAHEALDQLVTISNVMKRIEKTRFTRS